MNALQALLNRPTGDASRTMATPARWIAMAGALAIVLLLLMGGVPALSPVNAAVAPVHHGALSVPAPVARLAPFLGQTLTLSAVSGVPKTNVTATGAGFPVGARVNLTWGVQSPGLLILAPTGCAASQGVLYRGTINVTAAGGFACYFLVPGASPGAYWVSAIDRAFPPNVAASTFRVAWFAPEVISTALFNASQTIPLPPLALRSCSVVSAASGGCTIAGSTVEPYLNASNDPALNHTSTGVLAMAYTSYTGGTAPCASARPYSFSNIAFQTSINDGASWSPATYLGNPVCSAPFSPNKYPSAWEPTITSLADGTLVMAYVQYNATAPAIPPFYNLSANALSRLVVTESSNGGTSWSVPTIVNVSNPDPSLTVSFPPVRPTITAFGKTIYLTWMSLGRATAPTVYSHVAMVVSTTGGASWSPTLTLGSGSSNSANPNVLVTPKGRLFVAYYTSISYTSSTGNAVSGNIAVGTSTANGTGMTTSTVAFSVRANQTFGSFFNPAPVLAWTRNGVVDVAYVTGIFGRGGYVTALGFSHSINNGSSWISSSAARNMFFNPSNVYSGYPNASKIMTLAMTARGTNTRGDLFLTATVFNSSACLNSHCGEMMQMAINTTNNGTSFSGPVILNGYLMPNGTSGSWRPFLVGEYDSAIYYSGAVSGSGHVLFAGANTSCPSWIAYPKSMLSQCGTFTSSTGLQTTLYGTSQIMLSQSYGGATTSVTFTPVGLPWDAKWVVNMMGNQLKANGSTNLTVSDVPMGVPLLINVSGQGQYNASFQFRWASSTIGSPVTFSGPQTVTETFNAWVPLTIKVNPPALLGSNCQMSYGCSPSYFAPPAYFGDPSNNCAGPSSYYQSCSIGCVGYELDYNYYPYQSGYYGYEYEYVGCANSYVSHNQTGQKNVTLPSGATVYVPAGKPFNLNVTQWDPLAALCDPSGAPPPGGLPTLSGSQTGYSYYWLECFEIYIALLQVYSWFGFGPGNTTASTSNITVSPTGAVTETVNFGESGACQGSEVYQYWYAQPKATSWTHQGPYNYVTCSNTTTTKSELQVPIQVQETGLPSGVTWGVSFTELSNGTVTSVNSSQTSLGLSTLYFGESYGVSVATIPTSTPGIYWVGTTNASIKLPVFKPLQVTFTKRSLTGLSFPSAVSEQGLPTGAGWSFYLSNSTGNISMAVPPGWSESVPVAVGLSAGTSYSAGGAPVYTSNGTAYFVQSINVSWNSINSTSSVISAGGSLTVIGQGSIVVTFAASYWLTVISDPGGTVTATSHWVPSGSPVTMTATAGTLNGVKYQFVSWTGLGNGSVSGAVATIVVHPTSPVTELANFRPVPAATWTLQVQATGISGGTTYSLGVGTRTYSGNGTFLISNVSSGQYTLTAPTIFSVPVANTRWVATGITTTNGAVTGPVSILNDLTVTIAYVAQYLLVATSTTGGTISGASSGPWYDAGATVTLTAVPMAGPPGVGYYFVSWNGSGFGSGPASTPTITVTMTGPVSEIAEFALKPIPQPRTYVLTVTQSGLPSGVGWNVTLGSVGNSSTSTSLTIGRLNGTYNVNVPIVYGSAGTRYVPTPGAASTPVTANATVTVAFATQYLVTVLVSGGGTVTPSSEWVASGSQVPLAATANTSWKFVAWNGTQPGAATASYSVTVTGPVTETATFVPAYVQKSTTDTYAGAPVSFALLGVLLVVGLVVAFLVTRRGRGGQSAEMPAEEAAAPGDGNKTSQDDWEERSAEEAPSADMDSNSPPEA